MSIRIKPLSSARRVIVGIERLTKTHQQSIEDGLHVVGKIVGNRVKELITQGPKTGRVYRIRGRDHQASAPKEAPANLSGRLVKSFNYNVHGPYTMELGEDAEYAGFLEDGTRNIKPRPHVGRAVDETQGDVVNIFYDEFRKLSK
jgi:HK97 gp10 family phage protein